MGQVSSELISIRDKLDARDALDAERRKLDDLREAAAARSRDELLIRVNNHGTRQTALETKWDAFFGDSGGWSYVKRKIEATDKQNRWIIALVFTTLIAVIVNLVTKH